MLKSLKLVILIFMVIPLSYGLEQDHASHKIRAEKGTGVLERMLDWADHCECGCPSVLRAYREQIVAKTSYPLAVHANKAT